MAEARVRLLKTDRFRRQEQQRSVRFKAGRQTQPARTAADAKNDSRKPRLIQKDRHVRRASGSAGDVRHRRTDLQERELAVRIMRLTETVRAKEETAEMSLIVRQEATDRAATVPQEAERGQNGRSFNGGNGRPGRQERGGRDQRSGAQGLRTDRRDSRRDEMSTPVMEQLEESEK